MPQRISHRNEERFRAAKMMRPSMTFDQWVDELWSLAVGVEKTASAVNEPVKGERFTGKETRSDQPAVTGSILRPILLELLLDAEGRRLPRRDVIAKLESVLKLRKLTNDADFKKTSAGIPSWNHRLLSEIAHLRKRQMIERQIAGEKSWALTAKGVNFAKSELQR